MITQSKIDELRGMVAKATKPPWQIAIVTPTATDGVSFPFALWAHGPRTANWNRATVLHADDAALIVAAVNALPGLLDALEDAKAKAETSLGETARQ